MRLRARALIGVSAFMLIVACAGADENEDAPGAAGAAAANAGSGSVAGSPAGTWPASSGVCTNKPGSLRGKSAQMLMAARLARSFIYYAPVTLDANTPAPLVIVPHGYTMNAEQMFDVTGYAAIADREGFVVIFPNGQTGGILDGPWNVGAPDCSSSLGLLPVARGDDQKFLDALVSFVDADQCLDTQHVYVTGFSMGGYFANETGCLRPEVRAIAPHSGGSHDLSACASQHKPVLLMHFQEDGLIPYSCGTQARDRWVQRNGCSTEAPEILAVEGGSCEYYKGCPADGQVAMCSFTLPTGGMPNERYPGHGWAGGSKLGMGVSFAIPETASASELSWAFFKTHAW